MFNISYGWHASFQANWQDSQTIKENRGRSIRKHAIVVYFLTLNNMDM